MKKNVIFCTTFNIAENHYINIYKKKNVYIWLVIEYIFVFLS